MCLVFTIYRGCINFTRATKACREEMCRHILATYVGTYIRLDHLLHNVQSVAPAGTNPSTGFMTQWQTRSVPNYSGHNIPDFVFAGL